MFIAQVIILAFLSFTPSWGVLPGITNILLLGLVMYAMNSSVQMIYQDIARSDHPSSVTFSASLHPMSFNAGIALGSFIGGAVVNVGGYAATGLVGAGVAGCALGLCLTLRHLRCAQETRTTSLT